VTSAQQLARRYDQYAAMLRRRPGAGPGRADLAAVRDFMAWIEGWWWDDCPPEPATPPDAVSSGGWEPVRWYDAGDVIRGYAAEPDGCYDGCYRVPVASPAPAFGSPPRPPAS